MRMKISPWLPLVLVSLVMFLQRDVWPDYADREGPDAVAVSPDGTRLYVANSGSDTIPIIDTRRLKTVYIIKLIPSNFGLLSGIAVSPDGKTLYATASRADELQVVRLPGEPGIPVKVGHEPAGVAVTPDGARVYVANLGSDTVSVMDTHTNQVVATVPVGHFPADVAASPDGRRAYVTNRGSNSLSVIDTTTNQVIATVPVGLLPARVAVSPNGHRIYVTASAPDVWGGYATYPVADVIDATANQVMGIIAVDPWGLNSLSGGVAISPDGHRVYVTCPDSNHVSVIYDNQYVTSFQVSTFPQNLALSPDGARLYVTSKPRRAVDVIDTATLQVLATVDAPNSLP